MIRYALTCSRGHEFEAWFSSSRDFDVQRRAALVECPVCGDADVSKQLMSPAIGSGGRDGGEAAATGAKRHSARERSASPLHDPTARMMRQFARELHAAVREQADYVGPRFPEEARKRHADGKTGGRPIWGEASPEEARKLREEGLDITPLPPLPDDKN